MTTDTDRNERLLAIARSPNRQFLERLRRLSSAASGCGQPGCINCGSSQTLSRRDDSSAQSSGRTSNELEASDSTQGAPTSTRLPNETTSSQIILPLPASMSVDDSGMEQLSEILGRVQLWTRKQITAIDSAEWEEIPDSTEPPLYPDFTPIQQWIAIMRNTQQEESDIQAEEEDGDECNCDECILDREHPTANLEHKYKPPPSYEAPSGILCPEAHQFHSLPTQGGIAGQEHNQYDISFL